MRPLTRITPQAGPGAYKTYQIVQPLSTHFRVATCAEVECANHQHGWRTTVDVSTELGRQQAEYIRHASGRAFTETADRLPLVTFIFTPGQQCFGTHHEPLERDPIHIIKDGDWRDSDNARQVRADDWLDDFRTHQDRLNTRVERG